MKPTQAKRFATALVEAGILVSAETAPHKQRGIYSKAHGAQAVDGKWPRGTKALIGCPDVAEALLAAGQWTANAIRACAHNHHHIGAIDCAPCERAARVPTPIKRKRAPKACPCPAHSGGTCAAAA